MKHDSRLSGVLHVLLHMAHAGGPSTSEQLARAMSTNPVVVRRVMAGLREAGYVASSKGHGGGWTLTRDLSEISLRDVYAALGEPTILAIGHRNPASGCLVEQAVNAALGDALAEAEALLLTRLGEVTLADLAADFTTPMGAAGPAAHASHADHAS